MADISRDSAVVKWDRGHGIKSAAFIEDDYDFQRTSW